MSPCGYDGAAQHTIQWDDDDDAVAVAIAASVLYYLSDTKMAFFFIQKLIITWFI